MKVSRPTYFFQSPTTSTLTTYKNQWLTGLDICSWSASPGSWRVWCSEPRDRTGGHPLVCPAWRVCRTAWAAAGCLRRASSQHIWCRGAADSLRRRPAPSSPTVSGGQQKKKKKKQRPGYQRDEKWKETVVISCGQFDYIIRSDASNCETREWRDCDGMKMWNVDDPQ